VSNTDGGAPQYLPVPFANLLQIEPLELGKDLLRAKMLVRPEFCNPMGTLHGGAIISIADTLGAIGAYRNLPEGAQGTTTMESKTNFIGAAPVGQTVIAESTPMHVGKRTSIWTTRITTEAGKLVAVVTQTQMVL
jgi:1,4-dihydroxy-2-naphthoyl-CoA hydrolase